MFLFFGLMGCQNATSVNEASGGNNDLGVIGFCASSMSSTLFVLVSVFFR